MGPTKIYKTQFEAPETIRGMFGLSDTRNAAHGSGFYWQLQNLYRVIFVLCFADSPASAEREIKVFFPNFNVTEWYEKEEAFFREGHIEFVEDLFVHRICNRHQKKLSLDSQR